jgi:hypothetical protein
MYTELSLGPQRFFFDREATLELYRQTIKTPGAATCDCTSCRNFSAQREKVFPQEFIQFLTALGIDHLKEWEAFNYEFGITQSGHLYGWWFLFVGYLVQGNRPKSDEESFSYWLTNQFPAGTLPVDQKYCAVEFLVRIPWVLSEAP